MNFLDCLILGIVEGLTEFLPVSSTGHMILTAKLLGLIQGEFMKSFEIIIQLGAILAVVVLYWKRILKDKMIALKVFAAFLPTAIAGLIFYKLIKKFLLSSEVVVWSLLFGGVALILFEFWHKEKESDLSEISQLPYSKAVMIGLFQSMAMVPGVSRAAATIIGGLVLGVKRKTIVEFSFLLAVPTMLAATGLDLIKNLEAFSGDQILFLAVGFFSAFVVAMASIKFLLHFIQHHNFISFGVYRILVALIFLLFVK